MKEWNWIYGNNFEDLEISRWRLLTFYWFLGFGIKIFYLLLDIGLFNE